MSDEENRKSVKQEVYDLMENENTTLKYLYAKFRGRAKEDYLRKLYRQFIDKNSKTKICAFCLKEKENSKILTSKFILGF